MDRRPYTEWETKKDDARDWALTKARKLLAEHQPDPLDKVIDAEMERIIAAEEKLLV
jgi:trimethylamine:corrinoid methyltransferase-like protein